MRRRRIRTSPEIQEAARALRRTMTEAERVLWACLRNRRLAGLKFRRQHPIGPYVVDYYCAEARLVVEVDGSVHDDEAQRARDADRTAELEARGYRVIRFRNAEVAGHLGDVLQAIEAECTGTRRDPGPAR